MFENDHYNMGDVRPEAQFDFGGLYLRITAVIFCIILRYTAADRTMLAPEPVESES